MAYDLSVDELQRREWRRKRKEELDPIHSCWDSRGENRLFLIFSCLVLSYERKQSKELDRHMSVLRKRKRLFMAHYGSRIFVSVLSQIFLTRNVAPFKATQASVPHRNQRAMPCKGPK
ncbi:hypothetical protein SUGI_1056010 [Cryptomeria japonica]|nr:hypothetical protein SUGI_1056010 [Cryptomeria japonica]